MRTEGMKSEEATDAAWEATKGGLMGAAKWGAGVALLGTAGFFWSPVYRGTTIQFKVYDVMSEHLLRQRSHLQVLANVGDFTGHGTRMYITGKAAVELSM
ncbi:hypothetical protein G7Z17_g6666 [Cylindrodendrum hubeiense]|uniref:Uncharacterized protein n=1 Tax=Cylindrodendrum hubeiense TaxID=595255 RepID=A0A9P5LG31_9HYPO|nr:hypothetical protein G7Z17_g6666 [Cylindrodendrum hubeiense]